MIITKTPYRISFFGGGTDHPELYRHHGGKVLATTFDKYCYISLRQLPPFFDHKYRIVYSKIESINDVDDIEHPAVKEVLKYYNSLTGLEIHHDGDLPARSGLGSSSSFTVGMVNAMNAFEGVYKSPYELASTSIHIEQDLIKECVGSQDQISAAYGGFNEIEFYEDDTFSVQPLRISQDRKKALNNKIDVGDINILKNYERKFKKVSLPIYLATNGIVRLYTNQKPIIKLARRSLLILADAMKPVKNAIIDNLLLKNS